MKLLRRWQVGDIAWGIAAAGLASAVALLLRRDVSCFDRRRELRASAQAEKLAAAQMRDLLMASASHDLKTPLASIRLLTHLIKRDAEQGAVSSERLLERAELIELNAGNMMSLIAEMLDVARLQAGGAIELQPANTDLVALARKVAGSFELSAGKHRILVESDEPRLTGEWDANRLERVLANLIGNGLKYSPNGGDVVIRLTRRQGRGRDVAVLSVADSGIGIPARDLPRVFDWFHRASNVGELGGTGVGLPSAKLIVERHGGGIDVASRPGRGSTVTIWLPAGPVSNEDRAQVACTTPPAEEPLPAGHG